MAISTAGDLIALALRTAGILGQGQSSAAEDSSDALSLLNMMVAQWQRRRWLVWSLLDTAIVSTGVESYSIGPGQQVNLPRPDKIESAFVRLLSTSSIEGTTINGGVLTIPPGSSLPTSPVGLAPGSYWNNGNVVCVVSGVAPGVTTTLYTDYPLAIVESREDYNTIALKALTTFPRVLFYESAFPIGALHFWPIPVAAQYEMHIATKAALPVYAGLTDDLNLPPEYIEAALYSLAVRLAMNYGLPARSDHVGAMRAALATLRMANVQVSTLALPGAVLPWRGGSVAAYSDPNFRSGSW